MTDGLGNDNVGTLALLADTARAGRGGYWGGEGGGYGGPFASPSSNAVRINRNNERVKDCCDNMQITLDQAEESRQFNGLNDKIFQSELRGSDRLRDIEREMNSNARKADLCCCETQKDIIRLEASNNLRFADLSKQQAVDNGVVMAKLAALDAKTDANKEIFELKQELQTQKIFSTCGCGCGGGVRPCPPTA